MKGNGASRAPRIKHLFTDASCIRQRGIASWAGMLIDGFESHLRSGLIGARLESGHQAEIHAVRYALRAFLRHGQIAPGDSIIVHCDNESVCMQLHDTARRLPKDAAFVRELVSVRLIAEQNKLAICAKWIKGHQGYDATDWRALINQRVDREVRAVSRAENHRRIAEGDRGRVPKARQIEEG